MENEHREDSDLEDLLAECRVETFRSGGPGGQHGNKTESGVRITHIPTGITAVCRSHRSQYLNRKDALKTLQERLDEHRRKRKNRVRTRVPRREKRKRLEAKRRRASLKKLRHRPNRDES